MAENDINEVEEQKKEDEVLKNVMASSDFSEYTRLNDFIELTQNTKMRQDALDIMAADSTPSAIGSSYVADTLEPSPQGDLVTLVAKTPGEQKIIDDIYKRLNLPLDKIVYSLFKNAIVIGEFAHENDLVKVDQARSRAANEAIGGEEPQGLMSATEDIMIAIHNSRIVPKMRILSDTTRIYPILQYESVVGYVEVTLDDLAGFDFENDTISYKDVVIHSAADYVYVKFGFRTESNPLRLKIKLEDGSVVEYDIDQGRSLLEAAYPSWQTLSIMRDAVNLARLAYSASSVIIQTEVGNMSEGQIELARNKLKDLFENRLTFGRNGAKSYLQPQIKPNFVYAFTNNGVGGISTQTVGGDYQPGVLTDLRYFEDEFFGAMGAVKQHYARTEDAAGLDSGGAVEQYEKRYRSYVSQYKRLLGQFIKEAINRVLLSRNLIGTYNNFDVLVNKAYVDEDSQVINYQQQKLSFLQEAIDFVGITDEKKLSDLKLQALKTVINDKTLLEAFTKALLEESPEEAESLGENGEEGYEGGYDEGFGGEEYNEEGDYGEEGGEDLMDQISSIGTDHENLGEIEEGGGEELPEVSEVVPEEEVE